MQKVRVVAVIIVITLSTGFCVFLTITLIPHMTLIGYVAAGTVIVGLVCVSLLMVSFTWSKMGAWGKQRRLLVAGEVVAYLDRSGEFVHLSAIHEQAKVPTQVVKALPAPKESTESSRETVMELYDKGISLRTIAEKTGLTYYKVQQITSGKAD